MASETIRDLFWLALFLIAVAYFVGFVSDATAVGGALKGLIYASTGRDNNGKFQNYPGGGGVLPPSGGGGGIF